MAAGAFAILASDAEGACVGEVDGLSWWCGWRLVGVRACWVGAVNVEVAGSAEGLFPVAVGIQLHAIMIPVLRLCIPAFELPSSSPLIYSIKQALARRSTILLLEVRHLTTILHDLGHHVRLHLHHLHESHLLLLVEVVHARLLHRRIHCSRTTMTTSTTVHHALYTVGDVRAPRPSWRAATSV